MLTARSDPTVANLVVFDLDSNGTLGGLGVLHQQYLLPALWGQHRVNIVAMRVSVSGICTTGPLPSPTIVNKVYWIDVEFLDWGTGSHWRTSSGDPQTRTRGLTCPKLGCTTS